VIAGLGLINALGRRWPRPNAIGTGLIVAGSALLFLAAARPLTEFFSRAGSPGLGAAFPIFVAVVAATAFVFGLSYALITVPSMTLLQEELPDEIRGRVFGFLNMLVSIFSLVPLILLVVVLVAPLLMRRNGNGRLARIGAAAHRALVQVRAGLAVFRNPRRGAAAAGAQLGAWAIQLAACWALLYALGLDGQAGIGAAAAVLFAVNVTAVVPATPSNIGVFQLAVISVLHTGFGISTADALAYGVILQGVEIATAVGLGLPALVREGLTWSDLRVQTLSTAPVRLEPERRSRGKGNRNRESAAVR